MLSRMTSRALAIGAIATAAVVSPLAHGVASAETLSGWVGPTAPANGTVYLHQSTITNTPSPKASTAVWTSFGGWATPGSMGVQSRLFKGSALCAIENWTYNATSSSRLESSVTGDCGEGSYNSHGFVRVRNGVNYTDNVTFPTDPLYYPQATAATVQTSDTISGVNNRGESYGTAVEAKNEADVPNLVLSIGKDGQTGFVKATDLDSDNAKTVPLYESDGITVIGEFDVS